MKCVREQVVAQQDARLGTPLGIYGCTMSPHQSLIQHVVVHEGSGVDHFDDGSQDEMGVSHTADGSSNEQQQSRAQPLPLESCHVFHQRVDEWIATLQLIAQYIIDAGQIIGDRSQAEIAYDNAMVAYLSSDLDIKSAVAAANQKYPDEALRLGAGDWADMEARYRL